MERIIRPAAKALIINNGKILVLKKNENEDQCYVLPGGGQIWGENLLDTLKRECIEEIGSEPKIIGDLLFIRESYKTKNGITNGKYYHRIDYIFECEIDEAKIAIGNKPDENQVSIEWIEIKDLESKGFFPKGMIPFIKDYYNGLRIGKVYLGEID